MWQKLQKLFDPRGRPTVTAGSDHYFCPCCLSVHPCPLFKISQNFQVRIVIASGGTVGLSEWIIDGTHVLFFLFSQPQETRCF